MFLNMGWREGLVAIIVLLLLYVVLSVFRLRRLKLQKTRESLAVVTPMAKSAMAAYAAVQEPVLRSEPEPLAAPSEAAFPWNEPPEEVPARERIAMLERDMEACRKEIRSMRSELVALREEQQREVARVEAAPQVSPLYNDAMQIALQGHDAASISQLCGISRAEAELVVALVRNRNER